MIKNIVFDIGMVLVDFRWRDYMKELGFSEETIEVLRKNVIEDKLWSELDLGKRDAAEVIQAMIEKIPAHETEIRHFFHEPVDVVRPFPHTRAWLEELKARGYKLYLLSNYPRELFSLHERTSFNFIDLVDGKVVSAFEQMMKPQAEIYQLLLKRYDLLPEETVFLDDRQVNVDAAREQGIHSFLVLSQEQARNELDVFLKRFT